MNHVLSAKSSNPHDAAMTPPETTPERYEALLREARPEELQKAVLHAHAERLQVAKTATTTQDLRRELRERAEAALEGKQEEGGEPAPEGEAPAADTELQSIVTYALLTEEAEELREAVEPTARSPEEIIDRIRRGIGHVAAEPPRVAA